MPLSQVEQAIKKDQHLPGIAGLLLLGKHGGLPVEVTFDRKNGRLSWRPFAGIRGFIGCYCLECYRQGLGVGEVAAGAYDGDRNGATLLLWKFIGRDGGVENGAAHKGGRQLFTVPLDGCAVGKTGSGDRKRERAAAGFHRRGTDGSDDRRIHGERGGAGNGAAGITDDNRVGAGIGQLHLGELERGIIGISTGDFLAVE